VLINTPPFYGETTPAPDQRGGVGVDDRLMRQPRLLVPYQKPLGNVRISSKYRILNWFTMPSAVDLVSNIKHGTSYETGVVRTNGFIQLTPGVAAFSSATVKITDGGRGKIVVAIVGILGYENSGTYLAGPYFNLNWGVGGGLAGGYYAWVLSGFAFPYTVPPGEKLVCVLSLDGVSTAYLRAFHNGRSLGGFSRDGLDTNTQTLPGNGGWELSTTGQSRHRKLYDWYLIDAPHNEELIYSIGRDPYQFLIPA